MLWILTAICLASFGSFAFADETNAVETDPGHVLMVGSETAYRLTIPPGWAMGGEKKWKSDAAVVFHSDQTAWQYSLVLAFSASVSKKSVDFADMTKWMETQRQHYSQKWEIQSVKDLGSWDIPGSKSARVIRVNGKRNHLSGVLVFLEEKNSLVWFELMSYFPAELNAAMGPFQKLVQSYRYLAEKPEDVKDELWTKVLYWIPPEPYARAVETLSTEQGREFDEQIRPQVEEDVADALKSAKDKAALDDPYEVIVQVAGDGSVMKMWCEPKNAATTKLAEWMVGYPFPAPHVSPFYFKLSKEAGK
jgi:hypothetical protein